MSVNDIETLKRYQERRNDATQVEIGTRSGKDYLAQLPHVYVNAWSSRMLAKLPKPRVEVFPIAVFALKDLGIDVKLHGPTGWRELVEGLKWLFVTKCPQLTAAEILFEHPKIIDERIAVLSEPIVDTRRYVSQNVFELSFYPNGHPQLGGRNIYEDWLPKDKVAVRLIPH